MNVNSKYIIFSKNININLYLYIIQYWFVKLKSNDPLLKIKLKEKSIYNILNRSSKVTEF